MEFFREHKKAITLIIGHYVFYCLDCMDAWLNVVTAIFKIVKIYENKNT